MPKNSERNNYCFVCIDPGKHTGIVMIGVPVDKPAHILFRHTIAPHELTRTLDELNTQSIQLTGNPPKAVVCERFVRHEGRHGIDDSPIVAIAHTEQWCDDNKVTVRRPMFSEKNTMPQDNVLRRLGWWNPGSENRHTHDALRHALNYLRGHRPTYEKAFPR